MDYDQPRFQEESQSKIREMGSQAAQKAQQFKQRASERMRDARDYVKDKTSNVSRQVQQGAYKAKDWFSETYDEYPLAMGAAFMILGMAGGLAIPTTKPERRVIGKTGRKLIHRAEDVGRQVIDRGEQAAERAVEAVKSSIKRDH